MNIWIQFVLLLKNGKSWCKTFSKYTMKWWSVVERSWELFWWKKSLKSHVSVILATCRRALSWRQIGPRLLTSAYRILQNWTCISSTRRQYTSAVMPWWDYRKLKWTKPIVNNKKLTIIFSDATSFFGKCLGAFSWSRYWHDHLRLS